MRAPDTSAFEVYCPQCRVSHPAGTRICLHCGSRTVRERPQTALRSPAPLAAGGRPSAPGPMRAPSRLPRRPPPRDQESLEELPGRGFSPLSLIWIVLIVVFAVYRAACG